MQNQKQHIIDIINTVISEHVGVEPHDLQPSAEFLADYNADMETVATVASHIEHLFPDGDISFASSEVAEIVTLNDLYDLTLEKLNEV